MATQGPLSPGTVVDDASVGTVAWANPDNAKVSDGLFSKVYGMFESGTLIADSRISLVLSNGIIGASNKSSGTVFPLSISYNLYGSSSDLWGEIWTASDINNSNFGIVLSIDKGNGPSHYLKCTNFGFSIPIDATINGITGSIQRYQGMEGDTNVGLVDHIRMTVYYTEVSASTMTGVQSITGLSTVQF